MCVIVCRRTVVFGVERERAKVACKNMTADNDVVCIMYQNPLTSID